MQYLTKGTIIENTYEIVEEIGSGGGGIVFKAKHLRLQTDVVVKKIKDEVRGKVKIRQEADILKKLKHPYLPRVYDFIETQDSVYTVMDFISGESLDTAVKKYGRFSQKQVKKWAEQLGEALDYLHSQMPPIIHSDIKPANIMLTKEGNICLIDFNISLAMGGEMESAVGISAGFSPPEQYRDPALYAKITHNYTLQKSAQSVQDEKTELLWEEAEEEKTELLLQTEETMDTAIRDDFPEYTQYMGKGIDARSDIYSLGITLYYMLTGIEPPVEFDQRIPIIQTNVSVSEGFCIVLEKMMELAPADRYQNGKEFLQAVRNCHKLDSRYQAMHRKIMFLRIASLASLALGIITIFAGLYKTRFDQNSDYYKTVHEAQEVMKLYDFEEADRLLQDAKEISQSRIDAYEEEVYLLYFKEKYEECISLGETYINTMPFILDSAEDKELFGNIYYIVGNSYFELEDYLNAKNLLEYALTYNARNGAYYRDYAIILAKLGQIKEAQQQLDQGIELGLAQDSVYMAQGEIAHVSGQYEEAAACLLQTIASTSDMQMKRRAVLLCADVYKTMGNEAVDREIELLEQYRSQFEESGYLVMTERLAEAYTRKAQTREAIADECYEKALMLFQSIYDRGYVTYQLQQNMAILYENMDCFDEAEQLLLKMAEEYPNRYEVYKRLAYLEADRQQMAENIERDYTKMQEYYEIAKEKYSGKELDAEMSMLDRMMQELKDGGWFSDRTE